MRECNEIGCKKEATNIQGFGGMGATDAYCDEHQDERDNDVNVLSHETEGKE